MDTVAVIVCILGGAFSIFCSYKDYDWFFNNRRARGFVALFGREGARKFYYFLGFVLIIGGVVGGFVSLTGL